jgi:hypothetical protein
MEPMPTPEHRDMNPEEMEEFRRAIDEFTARISEMIKAAPEIRRSVAICALGSSVAVCETFGVEPIVEVLKIRKEFGKADELLPPRRRTLS